MNSKEFKTPLGTMIAIGNEKALYLLEFSDRKGLEKEIMRLKNTIEEHIIPGNTPILDSIEKEFDLYFQGKLKTFKTPFKLLGTDFQKNVWKELVKIQPGETRSYGEIARNIGNPLAFRAVAQTNSRNQLAIIVPCHRVINANGSLGGYSANPQRKEWLLNHEKKL